MTTKIKFTMSDGMIIEAESDDSTSDELLTSLFRQLQGLQPNIRY